ncbi:MAG TPA: hypothetical protein VGQ06_12715 [Gemmatimonadales bacterium]|jgi:hypothetical protein|nr:hypothetical protein [Gemmatimonadales bacterium]
MKRFGLTLAAAVCASTPAAAQWFGLPAWNSPKGGAGITLSADYGRADYDSDTDPLKGSTFGARGSIGLGKATITAGVARFDPEGSFLEPATSIGVQGAYKLIGGSLTPVAVNVQGGASRHGVVDGGSEKITNWALGIGVGTSLTMPAASVEPFVSVSNRWHKVGSVATESNIGFVIGTNVAFGSFGLHLAYDLEKDSDGGRLGVFGFGAHFALRTPVGM